MLAVVVSVSWIGAAGAPGMASRSPSQSWRSARNSSAGITSWGVALGSHGDFEFDLTGGDGGLFELNEQLDVKDFGVVDQGEAPTALYPLGGVGQGHPESLHDLAGTKRDQL
jgi:hypothetical protein